MIKKNREMTVLVKRNIIEPLLFVREHNIRRRKTKTK